MSRCCEPWPLIRIACSRQVDPGPGNGGELQMSPAVPSHRPASTAPIVSPMPAGPVSTDTRIPDAEVCGLAGGVWWCPAFLTLDPTPRRASPSPAGDEPFLFLAVSARQGQTGPILRSALHASLCYTLFEWSSLPRAHTST